MLLYYLVTKGSNTAFDAMKKAKLFRTEQQFLSYMLHINENNPHSDELQYFSSKELWERAKTNGYEEISCNWGTMVFRWIESKSYNIQNAFNCYEPLQIH